MFLLGCSTWMSQEVRIGVGGWLIALKYPIGKSRLYPIDPNHLLNSWDTLSIVLSCAFAVSSREGIC